MMFASLTTVYRLHSLREKMPNNRCGETALIKLKTKNS